MDKNYSHFMPLTKNYTYSPKIRSENCDSKSGCDSTVVGGCSLRWWARMHTGRPLHVCETILPECAFISSVGCACIICRSR